MILSEIELREILQCTKMTTYNKLREPNRFTYREIKMIRDHFGCDYNTACEIIENSVYRYKKNTNRL